LTHQGDYYLQTRSKDEKDVICKRDSSGQSRGQELLGKVGRKGKGVEAQRGSKKKK